MRTSPVAASLAALALLPACVTEVVQADRAGIRSALPETAAVVVPLWPDGDPPASDQELARDAFFGSILDQMTQAVLERDAERLDQLLRAHDEPRAPEWVREHFTRFRDVRVALGFLAHARQNARVDIVGSSEVAELASGEKASLNVLGQPSTVVFTLPGGAHEPVSVQVKGANRVTFLATFRFVDHDVFGNRFERALQTIHQPERAHTLSGEGEPLRLEFPVPEMPVRGVWREVDLEITLMPTNLRIGDRVAPIRAEKLVDASGSYYPPGAHVILERPLQTLQVAVGRTQRANVLRHIALAAHFMPEPDREAACEQLVRWLRLARRGEARVATAALRDLTGEPYSLDDRSAWLQWWTTR